MAYSRSLMMRMRATYLLSQLTSTLCSIILSRLSCKRNLQSSFSEKLVLGNDHLLFKSSSIREHDSVNPIDKGVNNLESFRSCFNAFITQFSSASAVAKSRKFESCSSVSAQSQCASPYSRSTRAFAI